MPRATPPAPPTRAELASLERRIAEVERRIDEHRSEVAHELRATVDAVKRHVDATIAPLSTGMSKVLGFVARTEAKEQARLELEQERAKDEAHVDKLLARHKSAADVAESVDRRIDGPRKHRYAVVVAAISGAVTLVALILAAVLSHYRKGP